MRSPILVSKVRNMKADQIVIYNASEIRSRCTGRAFVPQRKVHTSIFPGSFMQNCSITCHNNGGTFPEFSARLLIGQSA